MAMLATSGGGALTPPLVLDSGVLTASAPIFNLGQTWNNGAVAFTGLKYNVVDTASAAASLLIDLQVGGASRFNISKTGNLTASSRVIAENGSLAMWSQGLSVGVSQTIAFSTTSTYSSASDAAFSRVSAGVIGVGTGAQGSIAGGLQAATVYSTNIMTDSSFESYNTAAKAKSRDVTGRRGYFDGQSGALFSSIGVVSWGSTDFGSAGDIYSPSNRDLILARDGPGILAQRNGANEQKSLIYNTYTDASNFERALIGFNASVLYFGTQMSGTGTARNVIHLVGGVNKLDYGVTNAGKWTFADPVHFTGAITGPSNTDMFGGLTVNTSGNLLVNSNIFGVGGSGTVNFLVEAAVQNITILNSGMALTWSSNFGGNGTALRAGKDTGLSRISAGVIGVGNGAAGSTAAELRAAKLTLGAFGNSSALGVTAYSLTGSDASSMLDLAGTWNTTGVPTALKLNITNTASGAGALLADLQVGGVSKFHVLPNGNTRLAGNGYNWVIDTNSLGNTLAFSANGVAAFVGITDQGVKTGTQILVAGTTLSAANDLFLIRPAAATLQHGATDSASPIAQKIKFQGVLAGTLNTSGVDASYYGSASTGTGIGGGFQWFTSPAGSTGSTQNAGALSMHLSSANKLYLGATTPTAFNYALWKDSVGSLWINAETTSRFVHIGAGDAWGMAVHGSTSTGGLSVRLSSTMPLNWGIDNPGSLSDTGLSRVAAGEVGVGNGTQGSVTGTVSASRFKGSIAQISFINDQNNNRTFFSFSGAGPTLLFLTSEANPMLQFGLTTAAAPALRRNGTTLEVKLADNSAFAGISAGASTFTYDVSGTGVKAIGNGQGFVSAISSGEAQVAMNPYGMRLASGTTIEWSSLATNGTPGQSLVLVRDAAHTLGQRAGVNPQAFNIYNTWTDVSNYERGIFDWTTSANILTIGTAKAGTGSGRSMRIMSANHIYLQAGAFDAWQVNGSTGHFLANVDNTYDVGASGASRPRSLYVGTNGNFGNAVISTNGFYAGSLSSAIRITSPSNGVGRFANADGTITTDITLSGASSTGTSLATFGGGITASDVSTFTNGTGTAPGIRFATSAGTGFHALNSTFIGVSLNGQPAGIAFSLTSSKPSINLASNGIFGWASTTYDVAPDLLLTRGGAGILEQRNGANEQQHLLYNTYTDASNYERGIIGFSGSVFYVGTQKNGTGIARSLSFMTDGVGRWNVGATGNLIPAAHNTYDIGGSMSISAVRNIHAAGAIQAAGYFNTAQGGAYLTTGRGGFMSAADGSFRVYNEAGTNTFSITAGASNLATFNGAVSATSFGKMGGTGLVQGMAFSGTTTVVNAGTAGGVVNLQDNSGALYLSLSTATGAVFNGGITANGLVTMSQGRFPSSSGVTLDSSGRGVLRNPSNGLFVLSNWTETDLTGLVLGPNSATGIRLAKSSTTLQVKLGDSSAFTNIQGKLTTDTAYTAGDPTTTGYIILYDSTGTAYRVPAVLN